MEQLHGLVLSRKAGERICIGDAITIEIVKTSASRATVLIDAPKGLSVLRSELLKKEKQATEASE